MAETYPPNFMAFWALYPRKTNKPAAYKAWVKLELEMDLFAAGAAIANLEARTKCGWWPTDKTKIPHPSTWLHGMRWEDENWKEEVPDYERQTTRPEAQDHRVKVKAEQRVVPWQEASLNRAYLSYSVRATLAGKMLSVEKTGAAMTMRDEILDGDMVVALAADIEAETKTEREASGELVALYLAHLDVEFGLDLGRRVLAGAARGRASHPCRSTIT